SAGILFVGDSLVSQGDKLRGSVGMNTWDQDKANAAVRAQAALGARIVCAGHGPVVMDVAFGALSKCNISSGDPMAGLELAAQDLIRAARARLAAITKSGE
ncbi:MAG: hypothetical protein AAB658_12450, partial [Chloroflexota bacterium]